MNTLHRFLAATTPLLLLAACAGQPTTTAQAADAERLHCTREIPIGSSMPVTRCRTLAQIEAERAEAAREVNTIRQSGTPNTGDRLGR